MNQRGFFVLPKFCFSLCPVLSMFWQVNYVYVTWRTPLKRHEEKKAVFETDWVTKGEREVKHTEKRIVECHWIYIRVSFHLCVNTFLTPYIVTCQPIVKDQTLPFCLDPVYKPADILFKLFNADFLRQSTGRDFMNLHRSLVSVPRPCSADREQQ